MELCAPCLFGIEGIVADELRRMGAENVQPENGRVLFSGDAALLARANIQSRCAERIQIRMGHFEAHSFDALFEGTKALPWEQWIGREDRFPVKGWSLNSDLHSIPDCQAIIKKAVVDRLQSCYHISWFEETGPTVQIQFTILKNEVTLLIDTSGAGLHKRGYRALTYSAPLKETLAAGLIDSTFYNPDRDEKKPFADPFCGSGTLPIEAAMKALHIPPGLQRDFDFNAWACAPKTALALAKEEARAGIKQTADLQIFASDINPEAISIAKYHAKRAGVEKYIRFSVGDATKFKSAEKYGVLLSNPPYGERLGTEKEVQTLMRNFGNAFKKLPDWNAYILTALPDFERYFGKRADKKKKLFNANLVCGFYSYFGKPPKSEDKESYEHKEKL